MESKLFAMFAFKGLLGDPAQLEKYSYTYTCDMTHTYRHVLFSIWIYP